MIDYKSFDEDLLKLEANYSYKSDEVYYYNVHRQKALILKLQQRFDFFDYSTLPLIFSNIHEENRKLRGPQEKRDRACDYLGKNYVWPRFSSTR